MADGTDEATRIEQLIRSDELAGEIDDLMASSWPPLVSETRGAWRFRYTNGVTRRANSVQIRGPQDAVEEAIARAEHFYRFRDASPVFLASEASAPAAVVAELEKRGYKPQAATWMLVAEAEKVAAAIDPDPRWRVEASAEPTDQWFSTYWGVEGDRHDAAAAETVRTQLLRPAAPARFVAVFETLEAEAAPGNAQQALSPDGSLKGGWPASVGQVVIDGGWGCLQCLATDRSGRRKGAASQVLRGRANQALLSGATGLFSAVMANNEASLALSERYGFRRSHRYRYFVKDEGS